MFPGLAYVNACWDKLRPWRGRLTAVQRYSAVLVLIRKAIRFRGVEVGEGQEAANKEQF